MLNEKLSHSKKKGYAKFREDALKLEQVIKESYQSSLESSDSMDTLAEIILNFDAWCEKEEINLIHHTDNDAYSYFMEMLYSKLGKHIKQTDDRYTFHKNRKCQEALIIQALSNMHINANAPVCYSGRQAYFNMADFLEDHICRTVKYFHLNQLKTKQQLIHFNYTLDALTKLDLNQKGLHPLNRGVSNQDRVVDLIIDATPKIEALVDKNKVGELHIIRFLHKSLLIDLDIFNQDFLSKAISYIGQKMINNTLDDKLYSQLSIIVKIMDMKNITIPDSLRTQMEQYHYNPKTGGSKFEDEIYSQLQEAICKVKDNYPNLIDENGFDNMNPIVVGLDLEADILYKSKSLDSSIPDIGSVSFQVDGDRYHTYFGTLRTNAKTKLRDVLFEEAEIPSVIFSDHSQGSDLAEEYLIMHIIEPGFKIRVHELLEKQNGLAEDQLEQLTKSQSKSYGEHVKNINGLNNSLSEVKLSIENIGAKMTKIQPIINNGIKDGFYKMSKDYITAKNLADALSAESDELKAQKGDLEAKIEDAVSQKQDYMDTMRWVANQQQKPAFSFNFNMQTVDFKPYLPPAVENQVKNKLLFTFDSAKSSMSQPNDVNTLELVEGNGFKNWVTPENNQPDTQPLFTFDFVKSSMKQPNGVNTPELVERKELRTWNS